MKRIISVLLLVTLLFTTGVCLTSCEEDEGAEISVYLAERLYNFDPAGSYIDDATISILHLIYEPLFTLDDDGDVQKAMAKDYDIDKDAGTMTITLRESYWSSGKRVTAADFVWAWQRIINSNNSFECAPLLYDIKNARYIKTATIPEGGTESDREINSFGAVAVDTETIQITFESADIDYDAFLRNLSNIALSPVNRESFNNGQESYWYLSTGMIGYCNGPFRIKDLNTEEGYFTLARNNDYHRPDPKESRKSADHFVVPSMLRTIWDITYDIETAQKDPAYLDSVYDKMYSQAADTVFYMSTLSLADRKDENVKKNAEVSDALSTYSYIFNTENELFKDAAVRRVLSAVIDRNKLAEELVFAKPATGFISNGVWDSTSAREKKSFRAVGGELISANAITVDEAKAQLAAANAKSGAFTIYYENREEDKYIAETVAAVWNQLDYYTVTAKPCTAYKIIEYPVGSDGSTNEEEAPTVYYRSELMTRYEKRDFDVIAVDYQMFSTNALTALASMSDNYNGMGIDLEAYNLSTDVNKMISSFRNGNSANYYNAAYDEKIAQAMNTNDLKERAVILHEAEKILVEDMPIIPLLFNQTYYVKHKKLKNLDVNYYGFTVFTRAKLSGYDEYFFED